MKKVRRPKIVFIDWSGTLSKSKFWGHLESTDNTFFKQLEDSLFKNNVELLKPWMIGKMTSEDILKKITKETNSEYETVFNEFVRGCKQMEFVDPKIPTLIRNLKKTGTKVYIASNNMDSFDRWTIPAMKLNKLFDGIINSFSMKALKHDFDINGSSLFFNEVFNKESVKPEETILIDDSEDKDNKLTKFGIIYKKISDKVTLVDELIKLI